MSSSAIPYPRMARIKDAAAQFGCSVHYLRNLCRSGKVRYTAVSSRRWLVNLDSLARFFEQGEQVEPESVNGVRRIRRTLTQCAGQIELEPLEDDTHEDTEKDEQEDTHNVF